MGLAIGGKHVGSGRPSARPNIKLRGIEREREGLPEVLFLACGLFLPPDAGLGPRATRAMDRESVR